MKNQGLIADYLKRATIRLAALQVLFDHHGYPDVVRESQEAVELATKSLIRFLGSEPARVHDTSAQLEELTPRLTADKQSSIDALIKISKTLRRDRELAFYGTEDLTPSEFYSKNDAEQAMNMAQTAVRLVTEIVAGK